MGRQALTSHVKGRKHEYAARSQNSTFGIGVFLKPSTTNDPKSARLGEWSILLALPAFLRSISNVFFCFRFELP